MSSRTATILFFIVILIVLAGGAGLYFYTESLKTGGEDTLQDGDFEQKDFIPRTARESGQGTQPPSRSSEDTAGSGPLSLVSRDIDVGDEKISLRVPSEFKITMATDGLGKARFMDMSPDGRLFVADMVDYRLSHEGRVIALEDFNEKTGQFASQTTYLSGLRGPNSVNFYTDDSGQTWLYVALTEKLVRYPYKPGDTKPSGSPETVTTFPNEQSPNADNSVWHITRTAFFHDDKLYVGVGSGCNACEQSSDEESAMVFVMDPDGRNKEVFASGIRNAVGLAWANNTLYVTENGVDHLGADAPDDLLYKLGKGMYYGWPYCYEVNGEVRKDTSYEWDRNISCDLIPTALTAFGPHTAPLGVTYVENAHPQLEGMFLVSLHGSHDLSNANGYKIVRVTKDGEQETFIDGFLKDGERIGRPVHVFQKDENSFFFTDDWAGRVFYVYKE